jgi:hypothetical protein
MRLFLIDTVIQVESLHVYIIHNMVENQPVRSRGGTLANVKSINF